MGGQDARRLAVLRVEELRRVFFADLRAGFLAADFFAVRRELAEARTRFVLTFPRLLADAFLFLGAPSLANRFPSLFCNRGYGFANGASRAYCKIFGAFDARLRCVNYSGTCADHCCRRGAENAFLILIHSCHP